ncbi:MAG: PEP-CTERM sorting domain-containing protein [Betaproteobacteria bacterium]|nr:PEP-CTERM sorting domain-containing protein [Betaproteobacteria bacterium]
MSRIDHAASSVDALEGAVDGTNIAETYTGANITVSPVPEPSEWAMLVAGLGLVGLFARRRESTPALPALA